jgi:membrane protein DedA with SNARE-associated domain
MPPAGYLIFEGKMGWALVILSGVAGSMAGALFNYWVARRFGRPFFLRYGKYVLLKPEHLDKADAFFAKHGEITTFVGRLLPVIRQFISLPAGVARMPLGKFCLYTGLGAGIWVSVLTVVGYLVGRNADLLHSTLRNATLWSLALALALVVGYVRLRGGKTEQKTE